MVSDEVVDLHLVVRLFLKIECLIQNPLLFSLVLVDVPKRTIGFQVDPVYFVQSKYIQLLLLTIIPFHFVYLNHLLCLLSVRGVGGR